MVIQEPRGVHPAVAGQVGDGQPPGDCRMVTPEIKQQNKGPSRDWQVQGAFKVCLGPAHRVREQDKWAGQERGGFRVLL